MAECLSKHFEVHFVYGNKKNIKSSVKVKKNLVEIPLVYRSGIFHSVYSYFLKSGRRKLAKFLLISYYFFRRREIFDLGREFERYKLKTNLTLRADDTVLVSFPSIAIHNLGYALKQEFNCKLILDYRDPGVFGYQLIEENKWMSYLRKFFLKRNELRNIRNADLVITISDSIRNLFPEKYKKNIKVVRNGFDASKLNFNLIKNHPYTFKLVYLGSVYNDQLHDTNLFQAVRSFIDSKNIQPQNFQLRFIGTGEALALKDIIRHYNLEPYTHISDKMPIEQIYSELYTASMFFHLKYGTRKEIITSKQYDYLAFQKPILLPQSDGGDLEESIKKYDAGFVCNTLAEVIQVISNAYQKQVNKQALRIERSEEELYELSRQAQGEYLAQLIKELN
jgi:glycosyltransferase involved in cell wall biosynthesis